jgi:glycosyltransferase involved in cell wall biosynthesis
MGAHAAWHDDWTSDGPRTRGGGFAAWHAWAKRGTDPRRVVLIADFAPSAEQLHERLGGLPRLIALPVLPKDPVSGVEYVAIATGVNPLELGPAGRRACRHGADIVAFWMPSHLVYGRTLVHLARQGFRYAWLVQGRQRMFLPLAMLAALRLARQVATRLGPRRDDATADMARRWLDKVPAAVAVPRAALRVAHVMRTWTYGGVERQVGLLAEMQRAAGMDVRLHLQTAPASQAKGGLRWWPPGLPAGPIATAPEADLAQQWQARGLGRDRLDTLPLPIREMVLDLAGELLLRPVDVVHAWIDEANIVALLAAHLAGVPAVVMHVLGVSPRHWPAGWQPYLRSWYQAGLARSNTALVALSDAGRCDYAEWLDVPAARITKIRIGFPPPPRPTPAACHGFRQKLGIPAKAPVVIGVFRLDPEKRPLFFLEVVARAKVQCPELQVLMAGGGSLAPEVDREIARRDMRGWVRRLGQPAEVLTPMAAADVFLMTSEVEGTPNVSLEAQYLGCVPVLTDVGGCRETLVADTTGILRPRDDAAGLADAVGQLVADPNRRSAMAAAGRDFVVRAFAPEQMHAATLALYRQLLSGVGRQARAA